MTIKQNPIAASYKFKKNNHLPISVLFTGFSASGKTSLANGVEHLLFKHNIKTCVLDGDNIRKKINKDLGFTLADREENMRRVGEICHLFNNSGTVVLASFIAPTEKCRQLIKKAVMPYFFMEVFVNTNLETCQKRDPKQLYKKAKAKQIKNFTGITASYEVPKKADITIPESMPHEEAVRSIANQIIQKITFPYQ
ncbi:MAG: adenylyl-sulfate kinase [Wenyingzhuangia sp.]|uniref:adenylyl-sulfate kinase n=1 Tax=Wenyingzhuangia sp. TaxID=1964193 RepID=UPI003219E336